MESLESWSSSQLFAKLYLPLQQWLRQCGIDYPWSQRGWRGQHTDRQSCIAPPQPLPDSYAVWVSEIMLQQTRTETVRSYYLAWMRRWPKLCDLAAAAEQQVLRQWEGLGYYNRAIHIHRCAGHVAAERKAGGKPALPQRSSQLGQLAGIGAYTAAAIASLSHNEAVLALDTNVKRIFSRLYQRQCTAAVARHWQQQHSAAIANCRWRGSANISLIQLGQQVCSAQQPKCQLCPLASFCPTARLGNWADFPQRTKRTLHKISSQRLLYLVGSQNNNKLLLVKNRRGHLQHLWRLPSYSWLCDWLPEQQRPEQQQEELPANYLGSFQHAYLQTQEKVQVFRHEAECSVQELTQILQDKPALASQWAWRLASASEMEQLTLAGPYRRFYQKITAQVMEKSGKRCGMNNDW